MNRINNPHDGMLLTLENAGRKAEICQANKSEKVSDGLLEQQTVTDEDLRDIFRVLNKQSEGINVLRSSL